MKTQVRGLLAAAVVLVVGIWILAGAETSGAADDKDLRAAVLKIADFIEKNDDAAAKKEAAALAKDADLGDVMNLMLLRTKKGIGVGPEAGKITPDGIEAKLINIGKKPLAKPQLDKEGDAIARMAAITAAVSEVARAKVPQKDEGNKKRSDWLMWAQEMRQTSGQLGQAAKAKNPAEVKTAAAKLNSACNNCHGVFRD